MATRNTLQEAQEFVDFYAAQHRTFRITERAVLFGWPVQEKTVYDISERTICPRCGKEIWHFDFGNSRVEHPACLSTALEQARQDGLAAQEANRRDNERLEDLLDYME